MANDNYQQIAKVGDVREGDVIAVTLPSGHEVVLTKVGGQIYALDAICTHQEAWFDSGYVDRATLELQCPLHEGRFDIRTGAATHEPAIDPIRAYELRVEGNLVFLGPAKPLAT